MQVFGNVLTDKRIYRAGKSKGAIATSQGRGIMRAGYGNNSNNEMDF